MTGKVVMVFSFLSGALYGMETDLAKRATTSQRHSLNEQSSSMSSSYVNSMIRSLKPYTRKAYYGALPSLAAAGSDVPMPMPFTPNFTGNMTGDNVTAEYIVLGVIGGLVLMSVCVGSCGWACLRKERMNQYKVIEEAERQCQDGMEGQEITQTQPVDIDFLSLKPGAHYRSGDSNNDDADSDN